MTLYHFLRTHRPFRLTMGDVREFVRDADHLGIPDSAPMDSDITALSVSFTEDQRREWERSMPQANDAR